MWKQHIVEQESGRASFCEPAVKETGNTTCNSYHLIIKATGELQGDWMRWTPEKIRRVG